MKILIASQLRDGIPFANYRVAGPYVIARSDEPMIAPVKPKQAEKPPLPSAPRVKAQSAEDEKAIAEIDSAIRRGVGDDVAKVAEWLGADKAAALFEKIMGKSCGCETRRKWLNEFWPYKSRLPKA